MTSKQNPCTECGAIGREPHAPNCSIGKARSAAAKKGFQSRTIPFRTAKQSRRRPARRQPPMPAKLVNRVAIILDGSSSMRHLVQDTLSAVNGEIAEIKRNAAETGQPTYVSLYVFADRVRAVFQNQYINSIGLITTSDYSARGMTALYDGIGAAIQDFQALPDIDDINTSFLVISMTDGMENCSREFTQRSITQLISQMNGTDRWTFVFSGPQHSTSQLKGLGFHIGNMQEWEQTTVGVQSMSRNTSKGIGTFYNARSMGQTNTKQFFTPDLGSVKAATLQRKLTDVSSNYKELKIDNAAPGGVEWQIRNFVEDRMGRNRTFARKVGTTYQPGSAFYELTQPVTVQDYKELLIMNRATGVVYGGADARNVINMPTTGNVKVTPGNHGQWRLFISSTSVNRKLVRGTSLLYAL